MRITIKYESSWQNSFLGGSNNEPLPKNGRDFIGSMKSLKDNPSENFIRCTITKDTVMGILNRLIGDQRKLYQARKLPNYFFSNMEDSITFKKIQGSTSSLSEEIVFIRNKKGSSDQNSFSGMIKDNDPAFNSDYSNELWGILTLDFDAVCNFILNPECVVKNTSAFNPLGVVAQLEQLKKMKSIAVTGVVKDALTVLEEQFPGEKYADDKNTIKPIMFYCSALYLQVSRLSQRFDLTTVLTKSGGLSGIARRGFTPRDIMNRFTTGDKKLIWGNPYLLKEKHKKTGETVSVLNKESGTLEINLTVSQEKALQISDMIDAAGVSSFCVGKKGLAYVESIEL